MQVGGAEPDAVERLAGVADVLDHRLALDAELAGLGVGGVGVGLRPGVEALAVGADLVDRHGAAEAGAARGVAGRAVRGPDGFAPGGKGGVDREGIGRRLLGAQVVAVLQHVLGDGLGRGADAEGGIDVDGERVLGLAGPVERGALAEAGVPDRGEVGVVDGVVVGEAEEVELGQVERPVAAGAPGRAAVGVDPGEVLGLLEHALLRDRDDQEAVEQLVVEAQIEVALDLAHHAVAGPARVVGGGFEEVEEGHRVRGVRGAGRDDDRGRVGAGAVARGVADRAGLGDAREAHGLLGEADRAARGPPPRGCRRRGSRRGRAGGRRRPAAGRGRSGRGCRGRPRRRASRT